MGEVEQSVLVRYMKQRFPADIIHTLFASSVPTPTQQTKENTLFASREFSLSTRSGQWLRPFNFTDAAQMVRCATTMRDICRIDIGGIFVRVPRRVRSPDGTSSVVHDADTVLIGSEIRFDCDANDMAHLRGCCGSAKKLCVRCWPLSLLAVKAIRHIMHSLFACTHILCVFSGRRGVHVWVFDLHMLAHPQRSNIGAVFSHIEMYQQYLRNFETFLSRNCTSDKFMAVEQYITTTHKSLCTEILVPQFLSMVENGTPLFFRTEANKYGPSLQHTRTKLKCNIDTSSLSSAEGVWVLVCACVVPGLDTQLVDSIEQYFQNMPLQTTESESTFYHPKHQLQFIRSLIDNYAAGGAAAHDEIWTHVVTRLAILCIAKLDMGVTVSANHMLKIPFIPNIQCSGCTVSVAFDPDTMIQHNPLVEVPDVDALVQNTNGAVSAFGRYVDYTRAFARRLYDDRMKTLKIAAAKYEEEKSVYISRVCGVLDRPVAPRRTFQSLV